MDLSSVAIWRGRTIFLFAAIGSAVGLVLVGLAECIILGYLFGAHKIREFVNKTSDFPIGKWWDVLIKIVTPLILVTLIIRVLIERIRIPYENYSQRALFLGGWPFASIWR